MAKMETYNEKVQAKKAEAVQKIASYEAILNTKGANVKDVESKAEDAKAAVTALNETIIEEYYALWASTPEPLKVALTDAYMEQYKMDVKEDKDSQEKKAKLGEKGDAIVVIKDFDKCAPAIGGVTFTVDGQWVWQAERVCMLLNRAATKSIGGDLARFDSKYRVSKVAMGLSMEANLESNTAQRKALQNLVDKIIFFDNGQGKNEIKIDNHDLAFALHCLTREGKKQSVVLAKPETFERIIAKVLHRKLTDGKYEAEYAEKKNK